MTQEQMNILVPQKLREMEKEYNMEVLLAVESGSRAWGFASPDSDFDVRFIYKRPRESYLHLERKRDVIELPIDDTWDVSGWDLDKTLGLLMRSNPTLFEWMNSPIVYLKTDAAERMKPLLEEYYSNEKMLYHYVNTARRTIKEQLSAEQVKPKKYFYALRPVLACLWVLEKHCPPPVLFSDLTEAVLPDSLRGVLEHLLELKINGPEKMLIEPIPELNRYLELTIAMIDDYMAEMPKEEKRTWDSLNAFFISEISR